MPLDGNDVASKPAGTTAIPNTTIESSKFNAVVDDIYSIFNTVRTAAKGFTGVTSYAALKTALGLGTMAAQDATAVAITGGSGAFSSLSSSLTAAGTQTTGLALANPGAGAGTKVFLTMTPNTSGGGSGAYIASQQTTAGNYANCEFWTANGGGSVKMLEFTAAGNVNAVNNILAGATAMINVANAEFGVSAGSNGVLTASTNGANSAFRAKRTSTGSVIQVYNNTTFCGGGTSTGASTMTWDTVSDERMKEDWRAMKPEEAYEVIRKLPTQWFKWKQDGQEDVGWSAQKSHAVHPRLATRNEEDDHWGIEKGARTPWLWAAVSGLLDRVDELEARLARLEKT